MTRLLSSFRVIFPFFIASAGFSPLYGQGLGKGGADEPEVVADGAEIIVIADRIPGSVLTDIPMQEALSASDIQNMGVSSIGEVLDEISTTTASGRGRGGGRPVVLLNGRRIASFREIREYPPESIRRIEVFPEEVALQYGYPPNQRVVNVILQDKVSLASGEIELGTPGRGTFIKREVNGRITRIRNGSRFSIYGAHDVQGGITEGNRGISSLLSGVDQSPYRSLRPASTSSEVNLSWSTQLSSGIDLSLGGEISDERDRSLLGLQSGSVLVPDPGAAPTGMMLGLAFDEIDPIRRKTDRLDMSGSFALNGKISAWRWSFSNDISWSKQTSRTTADVDLGPLQSAINDGIADPYSDDLSLFLDGSAVDLSKIKTTGAISTLTLSGNILDLPAGRVSTTLKLGYSANDIKSWSRNSGAAAMSTALSRKQSDGYISLSIPLTSTREGFLGAVGTLSLQANLGYSDLSDFGVLRQYGAGLTWAPTGRLSASLQYIAEDKAPSLGNLGNPLIITPNVTAYDFQTGQTVEISRSIGGNPELRGEKQRDIKASVSWHPDWLDGLKLTAEYFRNRSTDVTADFPLLTGEIEAAFPDRVTRGSSGQLFAIDARPINYRDRKSDNVRFSIGYRGRFGKSDRGKSGEGRGGAGAAGVGRIDRPAASGVAPKEPSDAPDASGPQGSDGGGAKPGSSGERGPSERGRPPGGFGMPPRNGSGGWHVNLSYNLQVRDVARIVAAGPVLDFLHGSAAGVNGGTRRHKIDFRIGGMKSGIGLRLSATYQSGSDVAGAATPNSSGLHFARLASVDARIFIDFDQKKQLLKGLPFLKGSLMSLRIDNIFDAAQKVTDETGLVPFRYQSAFLDPVGRYFEIDWRKKF